MTLDRWALLVHAGATLYMAGLVWFVQLVHYPLFARVGAPGFAAYEAEHQRWTTFADPAQRWVTGQVLGVDGGLGSVQAR